jgi:hypothetical protein
LFAFIYTVHVSRMRDIGLSRIGGDIELPLVAGILKWPSLTGNGMNDSSRSVICILFTIIIVNINM